MGRSPIAVSIPLGVGHFIAKVLTVLMDSSYNGAERGVLDHDDAVDCQETLHRLNFQPTPLDQVPQGVL